MISLQEKHSVIRPSNKQSSAASLNYKQKQMYHHIFPVESFDSSAVSSQSYYLKVTKMLISINNTASAQLKLCRVIDDVCLQDI